MDQDQLRALLQEVGAGGVEIDSAIERLRHMPFQDLGFAKVDHHRALRHGMPEVIFGKGKTVEQVQKIAQALLANSRNLLLTRATPEMAEGIKAIAPETEYFELPGLVRVWRDKAIRGKGRIA